MTIREETFRLGGSRGCAAAIGRALIGTPLSLEDDDELPGGYVLVGPDGEAVGRINANHWLTAELADGRRILLLEVNSPGGRLTIRAAVGDADDVYERPPVLRRPSERLRHLFYDPASWFNGEAS